MSSLPLHQEPDVPLRDGAPPSDGGIEVSIARGPLVGLLLLNALLTILTLGFYRFWARTRVRQRLWSAVSLRGESFTYTGTGKELMIGFLVAMVALLPLGMLVAALTSLIPPADFGKQMLVQTFVGLGAGLLGLTALYFARRYLLTRTRWRGIHGGQDRELGRYMLVHLKAYLPVLLTLGLLQPWADAKTYNYRTGITWFGTERFSANATASGLWRLYLPGWLMIVGGYVLFIVSFWPFMEWSMAAQEAQAAGQPPASPPPFAVAPWITSIALILLGSVGFFLYAVRRSIAFLGATRLGDMPFDLPVRTRQLVHIPLVGTLIYLGVLALAMLAAAGYIGAVGPKSLALAWLPFLMLIVILSLNSLVTVAWTQVEVLRLIGRHLRLRNMGLLDDLLNRGQPAPSRGEGLADAIGDIGIGA